MRVLLTALLLLLGPALPQTDTGVVMGIIRTVDGKPAVGVRVAAMSVEDPIANRSNSLFGITRSDEAGRFRIENIPPGRYHIIAGLVGLPTFYPGTTQMTGATAVPIRPGSIVNEINFTVAAESQQFALPPELGLFLDDGSATPTLIQGRVVSENGGVFVSMPDRVVVTTKGTGGSANRVVRADGTFFLDLPWGEHNISLELPAGYAVNSITLDSSNLLLQPIVLKPRSQIGEIEIVLRTPHLKTIRGHVLDESSGASVSKAPIVLRDSSGKRSQTTSSADGSFAFLGVTPGSYSLDIGAMFYITLRQAIVMEDQDVSLDLQIVKP